MALLAADETGWELEQYVTTTQQNSDFIHFVLCNRNGKKQGKDAWIRFHGSNAVVRDELSGVHRELMKMFSQSVPWILEHGDVDTIYTFVTTETTAYGGYFHDLCQDEYRGLNVDYPLGDWGYALVGGEQTKRHLLELSRYGFVPGVSHVTSVGYSDGGYMSSMNALTGIAQHAVAWGGWVFAQFDDWKANLPTDASGKCSLSGLRLDAFISAGDTFYNGTSGWSHMGPPESAKSMRGGLRAIASFLDLEEEPTAEVVIAGIPFQRTVYSNAADDNVIAIYVDGDSTHAHEWLFHQEALLSTTARVSNSDRRQCLSAL